MLSLRHYAITGILLATALTTTPGVAASGEWSRAADFAHFWPEAAAGNARSLQFVQEVACMSAFLDADVLPSRELGLSDEAYALAHMAYWPTDDTGIPWPLREKDNPAAHDNDRNRNAVLRHEESLWGLPGFHGHFFTPTLSYDELDEPLYRWRGGASGEGPIPEAVLRARVLLIPLNLTTVVHGHHVRTVSEAYAVLQLAPNPQLLAQLDGSFEEVTFLSSHDTQHLGLLLESGGDAWLWDVDPAQNDLWSALRMSLVSGKMAAESTVAGWDVKGTLDDLRPAANAQRAFFWQLAKWLPEPIDTYGAESRAKVALHQLAAAQWTYHEQAGAGQYGNFFDLQQANLVARPLTRANMIGNYSLSIFYAEPSNSHFSIVATPRPPHPGLRTFALCDDGLLRVATGFNLNIVAHTDHTAPTGDSPCGWMPVAEFN
ncbi:MAG: hypothetical protein ABI743_06260 [bacterium]